MYTNLLNEQSRNGILGKDNSRYESLELARKMAHVRTEGRPIMKHYREGR